MDDSPAMVLLFAKTVFDRRGRARALNIPSGRFGREAGDSGGPDCVEEEGEEIAVSVCAMLC